MRRPFCLFWGFFAIHKRFPLFNFVLVLVVESRGGDSLWSVPRLRGRPSEDSTLKGAVLQYSLTPSDQVDNSLSDEAQALCCQTLKSASQARRAPQPARWRSRKDENDVKDDEADG